MQSKRTKIVIKADARTRERYIRNIVATYGRATADQLVRGGSWYSTAHSLAAFISGGDVRTGAGVIAVLSANKGWSLNMKLATDACAGKIHGHTEVMLDKVRKILGGVDPADVLNGPKTSNFFRNIVDQADAHSVTIDRHAHDIAVGVRYGDRDRGLGAAGRYNLLADCYREAARRLGVLPSVVQATTWVTWIDAA